MRKILLICISIIFLLAGCNLLSFEKDIAEMDPKDLPDVPAFQDDFTREFMASTEEVEDGYYVFQSKTGGYTMMYPGDAKMNPRYYEINNEYFESIRFGSDHEEITGDTYSVRVIYKTGKRTNDVEVLFSVLSDMIGYKGDYEETEFEDKIIYFATMKFAPEDMEGSSYRFFGIVKSKTSNQAVSYLYKIYCNDKQGNCNYDMDFIEQHVKKLMNSIEFINED